jgi:hypothetical protein
MSQSFAVRGPYDFNSGPEYPNELPCAKGEILHAITVGQSGWTYVSSENRRESGWIPSNWLRSTDCQIYHGCKYDRSSEVSLETWTLRS